MRPRNVHNERDELAHPPPAWAGGVAAGYPTASQFFGRGCRRRNTENLARRAAVLAWIGLLAATLFRENLQAASTNRPPARAEAISSVRLRGRVVCIAEEMNRRHATELPTGHAHVWGFLTADGKLFTLLETKFSEAIFKDQRVRAKELILKARVLPGTQVLEVANIHTVRDGVEQDFFYYCDVCSIKSISPEICACCREPVVLTEKPLGQPEE